MKLINKEQLLRIEGGVSISGTLINALSGALKVVLDVGRNLGSAIRRIESKHLCDL